MIAIGQTVEHEGVKLRCEESTNDFKTFCVGCYFYDRDKCLDSDNSLNCWRTTRPDGKNVIFKEIK